MDTQSSYHCLNCNNAETAIPLVNVRFNGQQIWICSQCMPILIHQPQQLTQKIGTIAKLPVAPMPEH